MQIAGFFRRTDVLQFFFGIGCRFRQFCGKPLHEPGLAVENGFHFVDLLLKRLAPIRAVIHVFQVFMQFFRDKGIACLQKFLFKK